MRYKIVILIEKKNKAKVIMYNIYRVLFIVNIVFFGYLNYYIDFNSILNVLYCLLFVLKIVNFNVLLIFFFLDSLE